MGDSQLVVCAQASVYRTLEGDEPRWPWRLVPHAIGTLIILKVAAAMAQSHPGWPAVALKRFAAFEYFSVFVFSVEYVLRVWSCVEDPRYRRPILGRLRFMIPPLALVDLIAIAPAFIPAAQLDLRMARSLRLLRILRLLKLGRYSRSIQMFGRVFKESAPALTACTIVLGVILLIGSSAVFYAERDAQPDVFSSITATLWWGMATLSTVGYGDVFPITPLGKVFGSIVALIGIGFFALPAGILTANYLRALTPDGREGSQADCPHCGRPTHE